jgi:hypothetical protein
MRGIWLFTWRSQLSWGRAPAMVAWLLVLPVLVAVTVHSPRTWQHPDLPLGKPPDQLAGFAWRLRRAKIEPLNSDAYKQILNIMTNEYARTQEQAHSMAGPQTSVEDQKVLVENSHDRIVAAAGSALDDRQRALFRTVNQEWIKRSEDQISEPAWHRTAPFYHWLVDFYFFIILPLGCVRGCGALIRDELQTDTLGFLTTRPIRRATLVIVKYVSQAAWLEIMALAEALLLFAAGGLREIPALGKLLPLFLGAQFLAVLAWSGLGLFLGQVTKRYLALALVYGLVVELGIGAIPTNINSLSLSRHLRTLLSHNAELQSLFEWTTGGALFPAAILLVAAALFVGLAALLFTFLEYHAAGEMQK